MALCEVWNYGENGVWHDGMGFGRDDLLVVENSGVKALGIHFWALALALMMTTSDPSCQVSRSDTAVPDPPNHTLSHCKYAHHNPQTTIKVFNPK